MDIEYANSKLEKELSDERIIKKKYGRLSDRIITVIGELIAVKTLDEIPTAPPDRRHKMTNVDYTWSIDLNKNYRMWIKSKGIDDPKLVTSVTIEKIFDDH